jgi:hypothetical protein
MSKKRVQRRSRWGIKVKNTSFKNLLRILKFSCGREFHDRRWYDSCHNAKKNRATETTTKMNWTKQVIITAGFRVISNRCITEGIYPSVYSPSTIENNASKADQNKWSKAGEGKCLPKPIAKTAPEPAKTILAAVRSPVIWLVIAAAAACRMSGCSSSADAVLGCRHQQNITSHPPPTKRASSIGTWRKKERNALNVNGIGISISAFPCLARSYYSRRCS